LDLILKSYNPFKKGKRNRSHS